MSDRHVAFPKAVMKWLLSRFAISNLVYFLRPRFSSSVPHSCSWFFPTRRSGSICKESQFNSSRHWPLCYTWIGYRQANGFRREPCYLKSWITSMRCQHSFNAHCSNLTVITTPCRCCQISKCIIPFLFQTALTIDVSIGVFLVHQMPALADACALRVRPVFPVAIPQMKHASSLATAATATFRFLPWRIIL